MSESLLLTGNRTDAGRRAQPDSPRTGSDDYLYPDHNPFSVRFVQPGMIPFFFEPALLDAFRTESAATFHQYFLESVVQRQEASSWIGCRFLADRFERFQCRGQIVGPHGAGKSTLISSMRPVFENRGYSVFSWSLHDRQRILPGEFWVNLETFLADSAEPAAAAGKTVIFLDGFEQLSVVNRFLFRKFCRTRRIGFLISTHAPVLGVPLLFRVAPSPEILLRIVEYLLDDNKFSPAEKEIKELYLRNRGNCRSVLFDLYDRFEAAQYEGIYPHFA